MLFLKNWCGVCEFYLEMFVKLIHQAGEELISILLFSYIQLLVPHLEDLQQTQQIYMWRTHR